MFRIVMAKQNDNKNDVQCYHSDRGEYISTSYLLNGLYKKRSF